MARETKIGLVVGLGFIVCFAIILSNRGAAHATSLAYSYHPEMEPSKLSAAPSVAAEPERRARNFTASPNARPSESSSVRRVASSSAEGPDASPNTRATTLQSTQNETDVAAHSVENPADANHPSRASASEPPARALVRSMMPGALSESASPPETAVHSAAPGTTPSNAAGRHHTVARGDTLWKIAEAYYGTRSRQIVDAIFEANRSQLDSPDGLVLGQELALPEISGLPSPAPHTPAAVETPAPPPEPQPQPSDVQRPAGTKPSKPNRPKSETPRLPRIYEVKPGDRLASIAQTQLGDRKRWKEIYELNKEQLPDPTRIRTGVKIRLPNGV